MIAIRLSRKGAPKKPFYHMVVADSRCPRDGRFVEQLGYYNPVARGKAVKLDVNVERFDYWVSQGANVSTRAAALVKQFKKTTQVAA
jgi:small subunit ribosomal protein S16